MAEGEGQAERPDDYWHSNISLAPASVRVLVTVFREYGSELRPIVDMAKTGKHLGRPLFRHEIEEIPEVLEYRRVQSALSRLHESTEDEGLATSFPDMSHREVRIAKTLLLRRAASLKRDAEGTADKQTLTEALRNQMYDEAGRCEALAGSGVFGAASVVPLLAQPPEQTPVPTNAVTTTASALTPDPPSEPGTGVVSESRGKRFRKWLQARWDHVVDHAVQYIVGAIGTSLLGLLGWSIPHWGAQAPHSGENVPSVQAPADSSAMSRRDTVVAGVVARDDSSTPHTSVPVGVRGVGRAPLSGEPREWAAVLPEKAWVAFWKDMTYQYPDRIEYVVRDYGARIELSLASQSSLPTVIVHAEMALWVSGAQVGAGELVVQDAQATLSPKSAARMTLTGSFASRDTALFGPRVVTTLAHTKAPLRVDSVTVDIWGRATDGQLRRAHGVRAEVVAPWVSL